MMFVFIGQLNASSHIPVGTLAAQLEESNLLENVQELILDGVTSKVSGGIVTLYNVRAISDTTTLNDYLEVDFLFDTESLRLIPIKMEKNENLGIYFRDDSLFSKDVPADIFLKTPDGSTLSPDQLHRLTAGKDDEFILYMEVGTVLAQRLFDPTDDFFIIIEGPEGDVVRKTLYEKNSRWNAWGTSILKTGNHIVRFVPENDESMNIDFSFTNNNRSSLRTLISGSSIQLSLDGNGVEYAKYKITLNAGDTLEVTDASDDDIRLMLVDENSVRVKNNTGGKIFYQAAETGDFYLFIVNDDANNGSNYSGSIQITPDLNASLYPILSEIPRQNASINSEFSLQLSATNTPESYYATGLPGGLTIDDVSGVISGTPIISGTFSIQVTAENEHGKGKERFLLTVEDTSAVISPLRITTLGLSVSAGVAPVSTTFSLEVAGGSGNYIYAWDFMDGSTASERSPIHEFVSAGAFNVKVTVTDSSDSNNITTGELTVIVSEEPVPYLPLQITLLSSSVSVGEGPLDVIFQVQVSGGSGNYDYSWDFGDGQISTEINPTHTFSSKNTYNVTLTVTDKADALKTTSGQLSIIITDPPSSTTQPSQNATVESGKDESGGGALGVWVLLLAAGVFVYRRVSVKI